MSHHGVVDQGDAQALAVFEPQRLGIRELDAVERPGELFHMAGEVQFDSPARFTAIRVDEGASQIRISEHTTAIVTKPDSWVVQLGRRGHGLHVDQRVVCFRGGMALHGTASRHAAVIHAGHAVMVHTRHIVVLHAGHVAVVHPHVAHGDQRPWV
ncbi:hypothetical protein D3C78_525540 [compost metagenome]